LQGIISSHLIRWFWRQRFFDQKKTFPKIKKDAILSIPLPKSAPKVHQNKMVAHVERMLKLQEDLAAAKSPDDQTRLAREIAATDRAIDLLVYQLYDLTPEEIALVEQTTAAPTTKEPEEPGPAAAPLPPEAYAQAEADAAHFHFIKEDPPKEE
jgi:hypothetical protein